MNAATLVFEQRGPPQETSWLWRWQSGLPINRFSLDPGLPMVQIVRARNPNGFLSAWKAHNHNRTSTDFNSSKSTLRLQLDYKLWSLYPAMRGSMQSLEVRQEMSRSLRPLRRAVLRIQVPTYGVYHALRGAMRLDSVFKTV